MKTTEIGINDANVNFELISMGDKETRWHNLKIEVYGRSDTACTTSVEINCVSPCEIEELIKQLQELNFKFKNKLAKNKK